MPNNIIKSFSKKSNKSETEVDKIWSELKNKYGEDYQRIVGALKKILKINENKFIDYLNETPEYLGNTDGLKSKEKFKEDKIKKFNEIQEIKRKEAKILFNDFKFIIEDNTFYVFKDLSDLYLFFTFKSINKTLTVKAIKNISNEKYLSFKVYRSILDKTEYNEIITGDALSLDNLKAHKNALDSFKIFVRTKDGDKQIFDKWEFDYFMKRDNPNEVFVLKESRDFSYAKENFKTELNEYLDFCFNEKEIK